MIAAHKCRLAWFDAGTYGWNPQPRKDGHVPGLKRGIELDATDRALIAELQSDGRAPFVELGRRLGLSEKTVRNRVAALLASDVIRIIALTDPRMLGFEAIAMVGLTTDPATPASQIAAEIAGIREVDYVVVTTGRYSVMVEILATDLAELRQVIEQQIGAIAGVRSMEIFPCFSLFYQKARFIAEGPASGIRSSPL
ncbi:MAG TPA: Lrp/AsnC family transcriptional regulator, partial [Chthoniobacter sp.]|nr:Lrp/AsnC family transcriptional regulator [Chthoniobacter sp.]